MNTDKLADKLLELAETVINAEHDYRVNPHPATNEKYVVAHKAFIAAANPQAIKELCLGAKAAEKLQVYLYNMGYGAGHDDTVEGCYTDILPVDAFTYHNDMVSDILKEQTND